jgi:hypothetical protein
MVAIVAREPSTPIVESHPMLTTATFCPELHGLWVKRKISSVQVEWSHIGFGRVKNRCTGAAGLAINAVVDTPAEAIKESLDVASAETC